MADSDMMYSNGVLTHVRRDGTWFPACVGCHDGIYAGQLTMEVRKESGDDSAQKLLIHLHHVVLDPATRKALGFNG